VSSLLQGEVLEALQGLRAYFVEALHAGISHCDGQMGTPAATMVATIVEQYESCQRALLSVLQSKSSSMVHAACICTVMDFARAGKTLSGKQRMPISIILLSWASGVQHLRSKRLVQSQWDNSRTISSPQQRTR
jgi:hypothetical protein